MSEPTETNNAEIMLNALKAQYPEMWEGTNMSDLSTEDQILAYYVAETCHKVGEQTGLDPGFVYDQMFAEKEFELFVTVEDGLEHVNFIFPDGEGPELDLGDVSS